jgi:hypothetical protein
MRRTGEVSSIVVLTEGARSTRGAASLPEEGLACVRFGSPSGELFLKHRDSNEEQLS